MFTIERAGEALEAVRAGTPLIQCITNVVASNFSANVLLAIGASPAMVDNTEEAGPFAAAASGLLINVGTLTPVSAAAMRIAVSSARDAGTPWVLDPVAVGALPYRTGIARELMAYGPTAIRGNASEVMSLAGEAGHAGRGVDSVVLSGDAVEVAQAFAARQGCVVAVTGEVDYVADAKRLVGLGNGHALMPRITGLGCALSALVAAFVAIGEDAWAATASAILVMGVAGEQAGASAGGPGSFVPALVDSLHNLRPEALVRTGRVLS